MSSVEAVNNCTLLTALSKAVGKPRVASCNLSMFLVMSFVATPMFSNARVLLFNVSILFNAPSIDDLTVSNAFEPMFATAPNAPAPKNIPTPFVAEPIAEPILPNPDLIELPTPEAVFLSDENTPSNLLALELASFDSVLTPFIAFSVSFSSSPKASTFFSLLRASFAYACSFCCASFTSVELAPYFLVNCVTSFDCSLTALFIISRLRR